jgi:hypothetical protein
MLRPIRGLHHDCLCALIHLLDGPVDYVHTGLTHFVVAVRYIAACQW